MLMFNGMFHTSLILDLVLHVVSILTPIILLLKTGIAYVYERQRDRTCTTNTTPENNSCVKHNNKEKKLDVQNKQILFSVYLKLLLKVVNKNKNYVTNENVLKIVKKLAASNRNEEKKSKAGTGDNAGEEDKASSEEQQTKRVKKVKRVKRVKQLSDLDMRILQNDKYLVARSPDATADATVDAAADADVWPEPQHSGAECGSVFGNLNEEEWDHLAYLIDHDWVRVFNMYQPEVDHVVPSPQRSTSPSDSEDSGIFSCASSPCSSSSSPEFDPVWDQYPCKRTLHNMLNKSKNKNKNSKFAEVYDAIFRFDDAILQEIDLNGETILFHLWRQPKIKNFMQMCFGLGERLLELDIRSREVGHPSVLMWRNHAGHNILDVIRSTEMHNMSKSMMLEFFKQLFVLLEESP